MISRQEFFARSRNKGYTTEQLYSAYEVYATCPGAAASHMKFDDFTCFRCGSCCRKPWRVEATQYDVLRWIWEGRLDILGILEHTPKRSPQAAASACEGKALYMIGVELAEQDDGLVASLAAMITSARDGWLLVPKKNVRCIFYDEGQKACTVYATRPEVCERFPDVSQF
jgi:Fe-S-cluster containining protein